MEDFEKLLNVVRRKSEYDKNNPWFKNAETYLTACKQEIDEVIEENPNQRLCYLEDELADVLWAYLNAVVALEKEQGIKLDSVIQRASKKYEERISAIESGISWQEIKLKQKQRLAFEHTNLLKVTK